MTLKQLLGILLAVAGVIFLFVGFWEQIAWTAVLIGLVLLALGGLAVLVKPPRRRQARRH